MTPGRTIAIGDIHGCLAALQALIDVIAPSAEDTLITLGDYIDRGPDSSGVLELLCELSSVCRVRTLLGNHEAMMLMAIADPRELDFWLSCGGEETLASYGGSLQDVPARHIELIRSCERYVETERHFFVHANYTPTLPLDQQPEYALLWEHLTTYLPTMHLSGKRAILGHTPQRDGEVLVMDQLICIDTYCYGTGWLTALDVNSEHIWQADRSGELRA